LSSLEKEARPGWAEVPEDIIRQIEDIAGQKIKTGKIVWGGYSNSACFEITLFDGHKLFVKGTHPAQDAHGVKMVEQEIYAYKNIPHIREFAPQYLGMVSDGDPDGWCLIVFEQLQKLEEIIWDTKLLHRTFATLKLFHGIKKESLPLDFPLAETTNYIERYFIPQGGWIRIKEEKEIYKKFLTLFIDKEEADKFFKHALPILCEKQKEFCEIEDLTNGVIHQDFRDDNILVTQNKIYIVDWPNSCYGSVELDLAQLLASLSAKSEYDINSLLNIYSDSTEIKIDKNNFIKAVCAFSGHIADAAYRKKPEKLPRLRQMQKELLEESLKFLEKELNLGKIPQINQ